MKKRYLTSREVRERYGKRSHMWIVRRLQTDPRFPKPKKFGGRLNLFDEDELVEYERVTVADDERAV